MRVCRPSISVSLSSLFLIGFAANSAAQSSAEATENVGGTANRISEAARTAADSVVKDIKEDGKNLLFYASTGGASFHPLDNKKPLDGEIGSEDKSIAKATFGVTLLPNTWRLDLSYSTTYYQSEYAPRDSFTDINGVKRSIVGFDEGKTRTTIIDLFTKPIVSAYGSIGFGFRQNKATFGIEPKTISKAVDTPNTGFVPGAFNDGDSVEDLVNFSVANGDWVYGEPNYAFVAVKTNTYYATYNLPSAFKYVPDGLGFSVGYSKDDIPIMLSAGVPTTTGGGAPGFPKVVSGGRIALNPETKSMIYSFGIFKTMDELADGFSFKTLSVGVIDKKSKYTDLLAGGVTKTVSRKDTNYTIAPAYVWKWGAHKKVFAIISYSSTKLDGFNDARAEEASFDLGIRF